MRRITIVSTVFASLLLSAGSASAAPWCAHYGGAGNGGGNNCGFYSFEQCMAAIRGNGGFCGQNPFENPNWTGRNSQYRYRR
jgi:hypothetical protein